MSQPKGSISRVSNLVYTRRGGLKTSDGSQVFSVFGGVQPLQWDPLGSKMWRELVYYAPSSGLRTGYYGLYSDPTVAIGLGSTPGAPTLSAVTSSSGLSGTYFVKVTAVDGVGGETPAGGEASISLSNQGLHISWNVVLGSFGYNIYIGTAAGAEVLWVPTGSALGGAGASVVGRDVTSVTVDSTWLQNAGQTAPTLNTTSSLIFTQIPPGGYSGSNLVYMFPAAVSVISTGPSAASATTTDVQGPPVTTVVPLRPTSSVQGGPAGGTPNDFANPQFAQDGNPSTASVANVPPGGSNGAQRTWTGFPASPSAPTALTLNVTSSWSLSMPNLQQAIVLISYSLNGGTRWQTLFHGAGAYAQATQSIALPTTQDLSQLRVSVTAAVATLAASGVMSIYEIWVGATTTVPGGFGGGGATSVSTAATPNGGLADVSGPLPQIVTFRGKMILALGNGVPPFLSDGSQAGTQQITNTFTAVYPQWAPSINYNVGDQIEALAGGLSYVFTATQGGTSGATTPTWSAVLGQTVVEQPPGNVIWKNSGLVSLSPAPPGAAHAEIYAGSLWVANTWPTMTADQLDGPSALRMSILNDPNGWNPLNAAQIAPDDSDECQGIKAFTIAEAGIAPENFLVFFKNFSTYLVQGVFGAANFAITRLQTDLGCVASRTIQFVPGFGIMRFSHLGFAVTDGINDKLQDPEAIRPYLFAESTESDIPPLDWSEVWFSKSAQTVDPPMYVAAMPLVGANAQLIGVLQGVLVNVVASGSGGGPGPQPGGSFSFSPPAINFGNVPAGVLAQTLIEITFAGTGPVTLNAVTFDNPAFQALQMPALPYTFNNSGDFTGWYVGINAAVGSYTATMTVQTSVATYTISVAANVVAGNIVVSPPQLAFPATLVGTTSAPLSIAITNNEPGPVDLGGYSINSAPFTPSSDFALVSWPGSPGLVNPFPQTIAPGQTLNFGLVATPRAAGSRTATLTINTNLVGVSVAVAMSVVGTAPGLAVNPTSLAFPPSDPGSTSNPLSFTISNTGSAALTLTAASFSNPSFSFDSPAVFPVTLGPSQQAVFSVVASPVTVGVNHGAVTISTSTAGLSASVTLTVVGSSGPGGGGVAPAQAAAGESTPRSLETRIIDGLNYLLGRRAHPPEPRQPIQPRAASDPGLPAGNYYVQVGLRGPNGVTSLSPVLGPFTVNAANDLLQVSSPALPPGYYGYRIWFGTNPAALDQFVDGNLSMITISGPGQGGAPPRSIPGSLTRLFCYDLVLKQWTVVDLPYSISAMKQFRVANNQPWTALGGSYDSAVRRWQAGDEDWDVGALATQPDVRVRWNFLDAEVHTQGATVRLFHNQQIIRGSGGPASISVTPQVNGFLEATVRAAMIALGSGQFEARSRILQAFENVAFRVSGVGPAVIESVDYGVQPKPAGAAIVFS